MIVHRSRSGISRVLNTWQTAGMRMTGIKLAQHFEPVLQAVSHRRAASVMVHSVAAF
jgi:hypothetical protein